MKGEQPGRDQTGCHQDKFGFPSAIHNIESTTTSKLDPNSNSSPITKLMILNLNPKWVWEAVGFNIETGNQFGTVFGICVGFYV
jgi:hypothetical protein